MNILLYTLLFFLLLSLIYVLIRKHNSRIYAKSAPYYDKAKAKFQAGDYQGAIEDINLIFEIEKRAFFNFYDKKSTELSICRGDSQAKIGNHREAVEDYNKAIKHGYINHTAYLSRAASKIKLANSKGAVDDYTKAIELNPNFYFSFVERGKVKAKIGLHLEAIEDFNKCIENNGHNNETYWLRGESKAKLRNYREAIEDFQLATSMLNSSSYDQFRKIKNRIFDEYLSQTISILPTDIIALWCRAFSREMDNENIEAIQDLDMVIKLDPDFGIPHYNRGKLKAKLGKHAEAIEDFTTAIKLGFNINEVYCNRGVSKGMLNNHVAAIEDFNKARQLSSLPPLQTLNNPTFQPVSVFEETCLYSSYSKIILGDHEGAVVDFIQAFLIKDHYSSKPHGYISAYNSSQRRAEMRKKREIIWKHAASEIIKYLYKGNNGFEVFYNTFHEQYHNIDFDILKSFYEGTFEYNKLWQQRQVLYELHECHFASSAKEYQKYNSI